MSCFTGERSPPQGPSRYLEERRFRLKVRQHGPMVPNRRSERREPRTVRLSPRSVEPEPGTLRPKPRSLGPTFRPWWATPCPERGTLRIPEQEDNFCYCRKGR